jgi:hypothetical protein
LPTVSRISGCPFDRDIHSPVITVPVEVVDNQASSYTVIHSSIRLG